MADAVDALTGLPTFAGLAAALEEPAAAVFLDIDGFLLVNDKLGHIAGDELLSQLATWLRGEAQRLRGGVFRVAGDEFVLLLPGRTLDEAAAIANGIVSKCPSVLTLSGVVFRADRELPLQLRVARDWFAEELYRAELASGRDHRNVVVAPHFLLQNTTSPSRKSG